MQNTHTLFWDLDGTLIDSYSGIARSAAFALGELGIPVDDLNELRPLVGPPLHYGFSKLYGLGDRQVEEAIRLYRAYFVEHGIYDNTVYPGIPDLLAGLNGAGYRLLLATCKPRVYAEKILAHHGLAGHFLYVSGCELSGERTEKEEVIRFAMERAGLSDAAGCMMIGDRRDDALGAGAVGMEHLGVLYGYGDREELRAAGCRRYVESVEQLRAVLLEGAAPGELA